MNILPFRLADERAGGTNSTASALQTITATQDVLIGIAIIAFIPALFWTAVVWVVSQLFALNVSPAALGVMAASIAAFLSIVCSAILAVN